MSSLTGSFVSKVVPDKPLLFIFGCLALTAAVMMLIPRSYAKDEQTEDKVFFHKPTAITIVSRSDSSLGLWDREARS